MHSRLASALARTSILLLVVSPWTPPLLAEEEPPARQCTASVTTYPHPITGTIFNFVHDGIHNCADNCDVAVSCPFKQQPYQLCQGAETELSKCGCKWKEITLATDVDCGSHRCRVGKQLRVQCRADVLAQWQDQYVVILYEWRTQPPPAHWEPIDSWVCLNLLEDTIDYANQQCTVTLQ